MAQARLQGQQAMQSPTVNDNGSENTDSIGEQKGKAAGKLTVNERAVKGVSEDDEVQGCEEGQGDI